MKDRPAAIYVLPRKLQSSSGRVPRTLTVHTAVCRMASKPPSGASRLPDIRSPCSLSRNSSTLSVKLMTFLKENGGSLLGQGSFSLDKVEIEPVSGKDWVPHAPVPVTHSGQRRILSASMTGGGAHGRDSCPPRPTQPLTSQASCLSEGH